MTDDTSTAPPGPPPAELDPERVFLGCVMVLPAGQARTLLSGMRATDFGQPVAALVAQLAIELLAAGIPASPVALLSHAETSGRVTALRDRSAEYFGTGSDQRYTRLAHWLLDTHAVTTWPGLGHHLKAAVLEAAWRRALTAYATRLRQAAEQSPADVLAELAADTTDADDLHDRYLTAQQYPGGFAGLEVAA